MSDFDKLSDSEKARAKALFDRLRDGLPPEQRMFVPWEDAEEEAAYADFYDDSGIVSIVSPEDEEETVH